MLAPPILTRTLMAHHGPDSVLARAVGRGRKEAFSLAAYVLALPLAFLTPWASVAVYRGLALAWIVSDKRIEAPLKD